MSIGTDGIEASDSENAKSASPGPTASFDASAERVGNWIGPYKLLSILGEGGMGIVYLAEQEHPIRRQVALKVIKPGMDSKRVIARFEAERQALALLNHSNIAHVFDAGTTENSRPYFVMEYVKGLPITEHCDRHKLTIEQRLSVFLDVCHAVHHAHQKGIIHRDIKPSNILVSVQDDQAIPKIIDFGVAKAVSQPLTERTLYTEQGQLVGTPEYMSPEQAEMANEDIDTRSDVYSLGVLLYVLLAGVLPFDPKVLREGGIDHIRQTIREQEPQTPSTRLTSLGEEAEASAQRRRTDLSTLVKRLHNELEWIPLKAIRKERARRYRSASEFADDIENYLNGSPLIAGPESAMYRVQKFVRKHRAPVVAVVAVAASLLVGLIVSTGMYVRAQRALNDLARLESEVESDRRLSTAQRLYAEGQYQPALEQIEQNFQSKDTGPKARLLHAQLLFEVGRLADAGSKLLELTNEGPEIAGAAHYLLARISLGTDSAKADEHKQLAESILPRTAEAYSLRAMTANTPEEALQWLSEALKLDPTHYPSRKARALAYYGLGDYQNMVEDVGALIVLRPGDYLGYSLRAIIGRESGQFEQALEDHNRAIELCAVVTELTELHSQRRKTYMCLGNYEAALVDARRCASLEPKEFGHRFHIFTALLSLGYWDAAQEQYKQTAKEDPLWHRQLGWWSQKYVLDTLASGKDWEIPATVAATAPFCAMSEAADCYHALEIKASRLIPGGAGIGCWSPDGRQIAYERWGGFSWQPRAMMDAVPAVRGSSGIEIMDLNSGKKRLLVGFGALPAWSPDGQNITFAHKSYPPGEGEVWVVPAAGGEPRKLASGYHPCWSSDSRRVFFQVWPEGIIYSIPVDEPNASARHVLKRPGSYPGAFKVSPDERYLAYEMASEIRIAELPSGVPVSIWETPWPLYGWSLGWSPDGKKLMIGSSSWYSQTSMWTYDLEQQEAKQLLRYPATRGFWSPDCSRVLINVLDEIWLAEPGPDVSIGQALTPALMRDDFLAQRLEQWTRYIEADPSNAENFLSRALVYISLKEYDKAEADLQELGRLVMSGDDPTLYVLAWWAWRYCKYELYEAGELLAIRAHELLARFPNPTVTGSPRDPVRNLVSLYEAWGKPELAEQWRTKLPQKSDVKE